MLLVKNHIFTLSFILSEGKEEVIHSPSVPFFPDGEYNRQKKLLEMELESLVVPAADAAEEAGRSILDLPRLWIEANLEERRKLLLSMLDAVYVDAKQTKSIVAIKPKPPFRPIFQVAVTRAGSKIRIVNEPLEGSSVFLVETGESQSPPETIFDWLIEQSQEIPVVNYTKSQISCL